MNYQRIYDQLIGRSKTRIPPEGYIEHHHIIPRCMNGSDDKENIAILTPEEHFVAHVLLVKIHPDHPGLIKAVGRMCKGKGRKRRKLYGWLKRRWARFQSIRTSGPSNPNYHMHFITDGKTVKRVRKEETLPIGWVVGKRCNYCQHCGSTINKSSKWCVNCRNIHKRNIEQLSQYYQIYEKVGWYEFVKNTGYDKTQQCFVMTCSKYLKEFCAQNGKKRGKMSLWPSGQRQQTVNLSGEILTRGSNPLGDANF